MRVCCFKSAFVDSIGYGDKFTIVGMAYLTKIFSRKCVLL